MKHKSIKKWQLDLRPRNIITHTFDLNELALCKIYDQQVDYCLKSLHLISSGTSRLVFEWNDDVVKVAKNASGLLGNYYEADQAKLCTQLFPQIVHVHQAKKERYDFIVVEKVIPFEDNMMKKKTGVVWEELFSLMVWNCMKDITDMKVRNAWRQNYNTYLRCTVDYAKQLHEKYMLSENAVSDFVNNILKYLEHFDAQTHPDVVSDFKRQNLGWSEKNNSIVILDNGSDVHTNAIWNKCAIRKKNHRTRVLEELIENGKINSKVILDIRKNK